MIYIKRLNFCFIRVPKNASSSIMHYLYANVCDTKEDIISHGITNYPNRISFINCPTLEHSHVDVTFAINNLGIPKNAKFVGVVRNPLEKQLSLYLFRIRENVYKTAPSRQHFTSLLRNGELEDSRYWQKQHQHTFLEYSNKSIGTWWLYENISQHLTDFMCEYELFETVPLQSYNSSPGQKKSLIDVFYTEDTKKEAELAFAKDIELYNKVKQLWNY